MAAPPTFLPAVLCAAAATVLMPAAAAAHPHVWIDAGATLRLTSDGRVAAVEVVWTFDDLYSEATVIDTPGRTPEDLRPLIDEAVVNLEEWRYFLDLRDGGTQVPYGRVETYDAVWRDGLLTYRFVVPLAEPLDPAEADLSFRLYDPTFYIDIAIPEGASVSLAPARPGCSVARRPAAAKPDLTILAQDYQSPDVEPGSEGIGGAFAETWTVTCR